LHVAELRELGRAELHAHLVDLLDAHAVLPGDRSAYGYAQFEDVGGEALGALQLAGNVGVVEDQRMQVAVTRVEDVGAPQPVLRRELLYAREHARQGRAWDRSVDAVVIGRDAPHRGERGLAPRPEAQPLGLAPGDPDVGRAGRTHHLAHAPNLVGDLLA